MRNFVFGFAVLMLVASLIPACGGGGGSGSAVAVPPPQAPALEYKVYDTSPTGPHAIAPNSVANLVRNISFAPPTGSEIVRIEIEGNGWFAGPTLPQIHVQLYVAGNLISQRVMNPAAASAYRGFRLFFYPDWGTFTGAPSTAPYPADLYNLRIWFMTPSATAGSVTDLRIRWIMVENPTVVLDSPLISG
jgi:hypothetical protein